MRGYIPLALALAAALGCSKEEPRPVIAPPPIKVSFSPAYPIVNQLVNIQLENADSMDLDTATDATGAGVPNANNGLTDDDKEVIVNAAGYDAGIFTSVGRFNVRIFGNHNSSLDMLVDVLDNGNFLAASDVKSEHQTEISLPDWVGFVQPFLSQDPTIPQDALTQINTIRGTLPIGESNILSYGVDKESFWWKLATALPGYHDNDGDGQIERWVKINLNNVNPCRAIGALDDILDQAFTPQVKQKALFTIADYKPTTNVKGTPVTPLAPLTCQNLWPASGSDEVTLALPTGDVKVALAYKWSVNGAVYSPTVTIGFIYGPTDTANQQAVDSFFQAYRNQGLYNVNSVLVMPGAGAQELISKREIRKMVEAELNYHRTNNP